MTETQSRAIPCVVFAFRFSNEVGFVQRYFAQRGDLVARELNGKVRCLLAFKEIGDYPAYTPHWAHAVEADFYDLSHENKERISQLITSNQVVAVVFQSAHWSEVDFRYWHQLNVRTINTEDSGFDHEQGQSFGSSLIRLLVRSGLKLQIHDLHIANTQGQYDALRQLARLPKQRLRLIPAGVDTKYYAPADRRDACIKLGLNPEMLWIMAAAQARAEKRVDFLLGAVRRLKEARKHAQIGFFYVGDGPMLAHWRTLAQESPSAADYIFFSQQMDMRPFYNAASIFVHAGFLESFGLVIAEAMASGLPVIATRAHGPAVLIQNGFTGYLTERDDWNGFVDALLSYIDNPELRRIHGEMGRERCVKEFGIDREASQIAREVLRLLS